MSNWGTWRAACQSLRCVISGAASVCMIRRSISDTGVVDGMVAGNPRLHCGTPRTGDIGATSGSFILSAAGWLRLSATGGDDGSGNAGNRCKLSPLLTSALTPGTAPAPSPEASLIPKEAPPFLGCSISTFSMGSVLSCSTTRQCDLRRSAPRPPLRLLTAPLPPLGAVSRLGAGSEGPKSLEEFVERGDGVPVSGVSLPTLPVVSGDDTTPVPLTLLTISWLTPPLTGGRKKKSARWEPEQPGTWCRAK
mmetsp:Transcript_28074/g.74206  ORF Transcript_28074/g.74206 Transcript_28074/m.74206 type:complete len:250 (-) Transcript_28074:8-757(-)